MPKPFEGKTALVTGAGMGMGKAAALMFAMRGANVAAVDVSAELVEETVKTIQEAGGRAVFFQADVSKTDEVEKMVARTVETFHRLDCAFNNAGITGQNDALTDLSEEMFMRVIGVNLVGVWLCMKYEIPLMLKQGRGAIVNNSSLAGLRGEAYTSAAYISSKHGVIGLTKKAALEYSAKGIRINAICPGAIRTGMFSNALERDPRIEDHLKQMIPSRRIGSPDEIAETVLWLCSDAASYITGVSIPVDGGWII
jgi:NAD(P)-dependent dehydrogenase (short-subunit alcohol dehydrogenase family)